MDVEELSDAIGANVRRYRTALGWSQDALAQECGLSKGTIVAIEQQRSNPSIATLCALAESLGVGLSSLLDRPSGPFLKHRQPDDAVRLWSTPAGSCSSLLLGTDPPTAVELWEFELAVGEAFDGSAHPRGTLETIRVVDGRVEIGVATRTALLETGDVACFEAHESHRYANAGDEPARFVLWLVVGDEGEVLHRFTHGAEDEGA